MAHTIVDAGSSVTKVAATPAYDMTDMLVLNFVRNPDGETYSSSVELTNPKYHNRTTFKGQPKLSEVFAKQFLVHLEQVIAGASDSRMLLLTDYVIDLGDLHLKGCRVMLSAAAQGIEYVMIRFREFYGRLNAIFRSDYHLPQAVEVREERLAASAMEHALLPLFNFSNHLDTAIGRSGLHEDEKKCLRKIKAEIADLKYCSDLLGYLISCREIAEQRDDHACDPKTTGLSDERRLRPSERVTFGPPDRR
jgi:hypothetical protein